MVKEKFKEMVKPIIEEAYMEGYKKCLTDIVERCDFIYGVIAEQARRDINDLYGIIDFPEATDDEFKEAN